jgi:hypothetical protein
MNSHAAQRSAWNERRNPACPQTLFHFFLSYSLHQMHPLFTPDSKIQAV